MSNILQYNHVIEFSTSGEEFMRKVFLYHLSRGLLGNLIVVGVSAVFMLISMAFVALAGFMFMSIVGIIGGAIAAVVTSLVLQGRLDAYIPDNLTRASSLSFTTLWKTISIDSKNKIGLGKIFLMLLSFLVLSAILLFFGIKLFPIIIANNKLSQDFGKMIFITLGTVAIISSAIFWFFYECCIFAHYRTSRCKCGGVMCYGYGKVTDFQRSEFTQTKTKDSYGTIGDVYLGNDKIGEIKGNTGSYTMQREGVKFTSTYGCQCVFCGKTKNFKKFETKYTSNWHY